MSIFSIFIVCCRWQSHILHNCNNNCMNVNQLGASKPLQNPIKTFPYIANVQEACVLDMLLWYNNENGFYSAQFDYGNILVISCVRVRYEGFVYSEQHLTRVGLNSNMARKIQDMLAMKWAELLAAIVLLYTSTQQSDKMCASAVHIHSINVQSFSASASKPTPKNGYTPMKPEKPLFHVVGRYIRPYLPSSSYTVWRCIPVWPDLFCCGGSCFAHSNSRYQHIQDSRVKCMGRNTELLSSQR